MRDYFERRITYDPNTQNYKVSVPELGLEILSDTEASGLISIREEIEANKGQLARSAGLPTDDDSITLSGKSFIIDTTDWQKIWTGHWPLPQPPINPSSSNK